MSLNEYFGDWLNVIDEPELLKVVSVINTIPKEVLAPCYNDIFKAFTMCTLKDCRVVFLGQDFSGRLKEINYLFAYLGQIPYLCILISSL